MQDLNNYQVRPAALTLTSEIISVLRRDTESGPRFVITDTLRREKTIELGFDTTLGILKPDAITRKLEPEIYRRVRQLGLETVLIDRRPLIPADVNLLYGHHIGATYYSEIMAFMTSKEVEIFLAIGKDAATKLNSLVGSTNPATSPRGTIRFDYYSPVRAFPQFPNIYQNLIHSSSAGKAGVELEHFLTVSSGRGEMDEGRT